MKNNLLEFWRAVTDVTEIIFNIGVRIGGIILLVYILRVFAQFLIH